MAAENCHVVLRQDSGANWEYPQQVAKQLGWSPERIKVDPLFNAEKRK